MGVELSIGCTACRTWIWVGSAKADKWQGFQVGNLAVLEWFLEHAHGEAALLVYRGDGEPAPWDTSPDAWSEDERSLGVAMAGRPPGARSRLDRRAVGWANTLWLRCTRCRDADRAVATLFEGTVIPTHPAQTAEWIFEHSAPECQLCSWPARTSE